MDRRAYRRVPLVTSIWVRYENQSEESRAAWDIGEGGLRMERLAAPINSTVWLVIRIPAKSRQPQGYMLVGRVVWKKINGTGVQFVDPSHQQLQAIRDYVASSG